MYKTEYRFLIKHPASTHSGLIRLYYSMSLQSDMEDKIIKIKNNNAIEKRKYNYVEKLWTFPAPQT